VIFRGNLNTIGIIKSTGLQLAGHVARMGKTMNAHEILVEKPL
jgi:hypothetical protein